MNLEEKMLSPQGNKNDYELVDPNEPPLGASNWHKVFAWWPEVIDRKIYWMTYVYRRVEQIEVEPRHQIIQVWRYGTIFDVMTAKSQGQPLLRYRFM
jgi:hypothetical protein